ncbi:hypothetical protein DICPUDRAFT_30157 [Dictyostelium purpureum]|uniref:Uncharacterized protein n=1 Tax=Dictyostelium purpureum TaxID=5786 RepID=F0ZEW5_DICPU|nr:uncharacterized protein DICPUDRAFT_30157 [Dictyostelium purpureum]EGC37499.1 hypothetical protein DICPUDRAFT_30157 [Dictyostelium purpureum]|eukprot:XP_003285973.1 hypothetical protein DICPUDRAFT_30157 [Dictyostelium purpureum]
MVEFISSMFDFREYEGFDEIEKVQFQLKWILTSMMIIRLPMCFISLVIIVDTAIEFFTIFIGFLGISYLKKVFLVSYCTLSEISFFLSSYGICSFLSDAHPNDIIVIIKVGGGLKIFFVVIFILWNLFQTSESKPLLFSFSASSERFDPNSSPSSENRMV